MTTYYVSPSGNNQNTGKTTDTAWKTLNFAIERLNPGDTLNVMAGEYDAGEQGASTGWSWTVNGSVSQPITIKSYGGDAILTGSASGSQNGYPLPIKDTGITHTMVDGSVVTYKGNKNSNALLKLVDCSYLILDGLWIYNSLAMGIEIVGSSLNKVTDWYVGHPSATTNAAKSHHIIIRNCTIADHRSRCMRIKQSFDVIVEDCNIYFGGWGFPDGGGGIQLIPCHYATIRRNKLHHLGGETIIMRNVGPAYNSRNVYIYDNISWDCEDGFYIDCAEKAIVARNFIYTTRQERKAPETKHTGGILTVHEGINDPVNVGIVVRTNEYDMQPGPCHDAFIISNIIVGCDTGILVKIDPTENPQEMQNVVIINNVVANSVSGENYRFGAKNVKDGVFKNNVSIHSSAGKHIGISGGATANSYFSDWDCDYNVYAGSDPTSDSQFYANLRGSNDQYDADVGYSTAAPDKGALVLRDDRAGYYVNFELAADWNDASGFVNALTSDAYNAGTAVTPSSDWNSDPYGQDPRDWVNVAYDFTNMGVKRIRSGTWDAGADEYGTSGVGSPVISSFTVNGGSSATVTTSDSVFFSCSASGGSGELQFWIYTKDPDNTIIYAPSGSHTYSATGDYTAKVVVRDELGYTDTATVSVTVTSETGAPSGAVTMDQILTYGGEASISTTGKPKAMFAILGGGVTDDTLVDNEILSMGLWAQSGQCAASLYAEHDAGTTITRTLNASGGFLHLITSDSVNSGNVVAVSGVDSDGFDLSWPSNHGSRKALIYTWYGDGVGTPFVGMVPLGANGSTYSWTGDYNCLIMPAALTAYSGRTQRGAISLGMAVRDGNQWCISYQNKNNRTSSQIDASIYTDRIAYCPSVSAYVTIESWTSEGGTIKVNGGDVDADTPLGLFNITDQTWDLGIYGTPTSTGSNTYTSSADVDLGSLGIDGQILWSLGLLGESYGVNLTDDTGGVFSFFGADDTNNYTISVQSDVGAPVSDESSYYADQYVQRSYDGTLLTEGNQSIVTDGFDINPTTVSSTSYKNVYALFETTEGSSAITASFDYYNLAFPDDDHLETGETIRFVSTSAPTGGYELASFQWVIDGIVGSTNYYTSNAFSTPGWHTVSLTVTDTNAAEATVEKVIYIWLGQFQIEYDDSVAIYPPWGYGEVPLTCYIYGDYVTVTPPEGGTISKWIWEVAGRRFVTDPGDDVSWYQEEPGNFTLWFSVEYEPIPGTYGTTQWHGFDNQFVFVDLISSDVKILSDIGPYRTIHSDQEVKFGVSAYSIVQTNDKHTYDTILWDFGDGTTLDSTDGDSYTDYWEPTHTYEADVPFYKWYDVTVTLNDGLDTEISGVFTNFIGVFRSDWNYYKIVAQNIDELITRIQNLKAIDFLDGTWIQESSPNTNVWTHTESMPWADSGVYVVEDGTPLTPQNSIADCQANAGSYYVSGTSPLVVHVHASDSGSPNTNGSAYRWLYGFKINVHDTVSVGESVTAGGIRNISVTDALTAGESVSASGPMNPSLSDAVSLSESITVQIQAIVYARNANVSDDIEVGESVTVSIP